MKIKDIRIKNNLFLAPMAGVTDAAFREICKSFGAGLTYTEMISAKGLLYKNKKTERLLEIAPNESPCAVQIFGHEPQVFKKVIESGILDKFDIIDINMGCPAPKIVKNGDGSALLKNFPLAAEIIKTCVGAVAGRAPFRAQSSAAKNFCDRLAGKNSDCRNGRRWNSASTEIYHTEMCLSAETGTVCADSSKINIAGMDISNGLAGKNSGTGKICDKEIKDKNMMPCKTKPGHSAQAVTVKFRMGYGLNDDIAMEFAKMCEACGAAAITIHGRTREQFYSGKVNLDVIKRVKQAVKIPVIGNGDVTDAASYNKMLETGCDAVMIGRGALGSPEIFSTLQGIKVKANKLEIIKKHLGLLVKYQLSNIKYQLRIENKNADRNSLVNINDKLTNDNSECADELSSDKIKDNKKDKPLKEKDIVVAFRKHLLWYIKDVPNAGKTRRELMAYTKIEEIMECLEKLFMS